MLLQSDSTAELPFTPTALQINWKAAECKIKSAKSNATKTHFLFYFNLIFTRFFHLNNFRLVAKKAKLHQKKANQSQVGAFAL